MPDRTKPPKIRDIQSLKLPAVEKRQLDNGTPVYVVNLGTQEVIKLEVIFHAGRPFERQPLAARATASQIREGSRHYTSAAVAEALDFYGCTLSIPFQLDHSSFTLYSLNKHFDQALTLLKDLLQHPAFPDKELQSFKLRNQRRLEIDLSKNDVVAYREATARIFGESHPYGYNSQPATYEALQREHLIAHHRQLYNKDNCVIFLSGRVDETLFEKVNAVFTSALPAGQAAKADWATPPPRACQERIERPNTVQSAIRIGRSLFKQQHEDYMGMYVLNTLLGGYFSSRLMTNLREEKGYTYNIYSSVDVMRYGGQLLIGTEVGKDFVEDSLAQIYLEMERLQQERVGEEELQMVRNYLLGTFLTMLDGPFNVAEVVRTQILEDLPMDYLEQLAATVQEISPEQLQNLAQRYLDREKMAEVVVGP